MMYISWIKELASTFKCQDHYCQGLCKYTDVCDNIHDYLSALEYYLK